MKQPDPTGFGPRVFTKLRYSKDAINLNWRMLVLNCMDKADRKMRMEYLAKLLELFAADIRKQAAKL